jgi:hypothetical protein
VGTNILKQYTASVFMEEGHFLQILSTHLPGYCVSPEDHNMSDAKIFQTPSNKMFKDVLSDEFLSSKTLFKIILRKG